MPSATARPDLYISADVETDGSIPATYSMLSFGLAVVGRYDGSSFQREDPRARTFYRELRPMTSSYDEEALAVNGLDREALLLDGADPADAMRDAAAWIDDVSVGHRPVLVAYPVAFDWAFLHWYFVHFGVSSPFGHSSCLDIKTLYQTMSGSVLDQSGKSAMPRALWPSAPHTHDALDDAVEQGELFANLAIWAQHLRQRAAMSERAPSTAPSWLGSYVTPIA